MRLSDSNGGRYHNGNEFCIHSHCDPCPLLTASKRSQHHHACLLQCKHKTTATLPYFNDTGMDQATLHMLGAITDSERYASLRCIACNEERRHLNASGGLNDIRRFAKAGHPKGPGTSNNVHDSCYMARARCCSLTISLACCMGTNASGKPVRGRGLIFESHSRTGMKQGHHCTTC